MQNLLTHNTIQNTQNVPRNTTTPTRHHALITESKRPAAPTAGAGAEQLHRLATLARHAQHDVGGDMPPVTPTTDPKNPRVQPRKGDHGRLMAMRFE